LEDYTKFKLKRKEELTPLLEDKDNLFVEACNKCYKEFELCEEPECGQLEQLAGELGKTVVGSVKVDFLCNKTLTAKKLKAVLPAEAENVFVISCGLGIQTVADLAEKPVYAASDSISYNGYHGMALTKLNCDACGHCAAECPKSIIRVEGNSARVAEEDMLKCSLCKLCEQVCDISAIQIDFHENAFLFSMESDGSYTAKDLTLNASKVVKDKAEEIVQILSQL